MSVYFVSGIDTDIGKSVAVGLMARYLVTAGVRAITVKLVQTGNVGFSEDLARHRALMGGGALPEDAEGLTAPAIFKFPASPHLAARLEGREVDTTAIRRAVATLNARYATVLLEGAGGLAVPLTERLLTVDFAAAEGYGLILVTSGRLGSLNHTLLSLEAAARRGLKLAGIVFNDFPATDAVIGNDTAEMIVKYLPEYGYAGAPLVRMPEANAATTIDFGAIFGVKP